MEIPRYGREPTTAFLASLKSHGYTSWHTFDLTRSKVGFWRALGLGLAAHGHRRYDSKDHYLRGSWRPKVQPLLSIEDRFSRDQGNDRFSNPHYWTELGSQCLSLAIEFYTKDGKTDQATTIRSGNLIAFENRSAYRNLATFLCLDLCVYEQRTDGRVATMEYRSDARGSIGLCINLGKDGDRLYLLYHRGLEERVTEGFPFLLEYGVPHPILIDSVVGTLTPPTTDNPWEIVSRGMAEVIEAQARLLLMVTDQVPARASEAMEVLKRKVHSVKVVIEGTRVDVSLDLIALSKLLSLNTAKPEAVRPLHTVVSCALYPEDSDYVNFHEHQFHRSCLRLYLESLSLQPPALPVCPIPLCGTEFPETVIELSEAVCMRYERYRQATTHRAATTDAKVSHMAFNPNMTLPASVSAMATCLVCERSCERAWMMPHGCCVCVYCAAVTFVTGGGTCRLCGIQHPEAEVEAIKNYREHYRMT